MVDLSSGGWPARISDLKKQTVELRETRQRVAKDLKAAQRKNKRLKERARSLSEEDMLQILVMKRTRVTVAGTSDGAGSSGSGSGGSAASTPVAVGTESAVAIPAAVGTAVNAADESGDLRMDA